MRGPGGSEAVHAAGPVGIASWHSPRGEKRRAGKERERKRRWHREEGGRREGESGRASKRAVEGERERGSE